MSDRAPKRGRGGPSIASPALATGKASPETPRRQANESSNLELQAYKSQMMRSSMPAFSQSQQQQPSSPSIPPPGKMLLPPLPRPNSAIINSSTNAEKNRISHACDKCRRAKAKCSGGLPCVKCRNEGKECIYGAGKRDKERKYVS